MGLFSSLFRTNYKGNIIEVESQTLLRGHVGVRHNLIINNEEIDHVEGFTGHFTLRGFISQYVDQSTPVIISIKQGLFGTKYKLEINGVEYKMNKIC